MSVYLGGPVEGDLRYNVVPIKKLGEGAFGVATLYKLEPPIRKQNGEIRDYVVRKKAHGKAEAVSLLRTEVRILRGIAQFKDSHDRPHVSSSHFRMSEPLVPK